MSKVAQLVTAILILLLCAVGLVALSVLYVRMDGKKIATNNDLCPSDRAPKGHVVVAVDWTDPFSEQQREALRDVVRRLKHDVRVDERLSLVHITGNPEDSAKPIFSVCKPLDLENINPLVENERRLKMKWEDQFGRPLDEKLTQLLQGSTAPHSPILEAIDVILWSHNFQADLQRRQLVIFSDLLQNWQGHSHYKNVPAACEFMRTASAQRLKARNWEGVSVVLHRWRNARDSQLQSEAHLNFWTDIFYHFGAAEVRVGTKLVDRGPSCIVTQGVHPAQPKPHKPKPRKKDDGWFGFTMPTLPATKN
jgi:hypothetical protein